MPTKDRPDLEALMERARSTSPTADQREEQRRSFAYGNLAIDNMAITREMIDEAASSIDAGMDCSRLGATWPEPREPDTRLHESPLLNRAEHWKQLQYPIQCGDSVLHRPSGETWVVAAADHDSDSVMWCGRPEGWALISHCEINRRASRASSAKLHAELSGLRRRLADRVYGPDNSKFPAWRP